MIHTIGLGSGVSSSVLSAMATGTGDQFFSADQADQLYDIFDNIADTSDLRKDTDSDGIKDYYEKEMAAGHLRLGSGVPLTGIDYQDPDYDGDGLRDGQEITVVKVGDKIFVRMTSNPTLSDSDFDGKLDIEDTRPLSNVFNYNYQNSDFNVNANVSFQMDYRLFFQDNTQYSRTLSKISSMMAAGMYPSNTLDGVHSNDLLKEFGMKDVLTDVVGQSIDDHQCGYSIGYHEVTYKGEPKTIVAVMVRGTSSAKELQSNFDVGSAAFARPEDWTDTENHMGFDIAATRIYNNLQRYINSRDFSTDQLVFWVAGHSRGAAVANIIGAKLADDGRTAFTHTFATPTTTTSKDAESTKYDSIFNIVNTDDLVPRMPLSAWQFKWYGQTASKSITELYKSKWESLSGTGEKYVHSNTDKLITALGKIAQNRDECYILTCDHARHDGTNGSISSGGDGSDNRITNTSWLYEGFMNNIPYNMIPYCGLISYNDNIPMDNKLVDMCQTPAYFMQHLALLASAEGYVDKIIELFRDVAPRYEATKRAMVLANLTNGGVAKPHYPISYYLLSTHINSQDF